MVVAPFLFLPLSRSSLFELVSFAILSSPAFSYELSSIVITLQMAKSKNHTNHNQSMYRRLYGAHVLIISLEKKWCEHRISKSNWKTYSFLALVTSHTPTEPFFFGERGGDN